MKLMATLCFEVAWLSSLISLADSPRLEVNWEGPTIPVFTPRDGGVWYPRLLERPDGTLLCVYDTNDGGGNTRVQVSQSRDGGKTWSVSGTASFGVGQAANGQLTATQDGGILCAYRLVRGSEKQLRVSSSRDGGSTWRHLSTIVTNTEGAWEPHLTELPNQELLAFYATEAIRPQAIAVKRSRDGGHTWGEETIVASHPRSRDGMPVAALRPDGSLIVVFEAQDAGHPFVVRSVVSHDEGRTWCDRRLVYAPQEAQKRASAPFVVALSSGELVASFQTDEDRTGFGDGHCDMKLVTSTDGGQSWAKLPVPFANERGTTVWNSLLVLKDRDLFALTSRGTGGRFEIILKRGHLAIRP